MELETCVTDTDVSQQAAHQSDDHLRSTSIQISIELHIHIVEVLENSVKKSKEAAWDGWFITIYVRLDIMQGIVLLDSLAPVIARKKNTELWAVILILSKSTVYPCIP